MTISLVVGSTMAVSANQGHRATCSNGESFYSKSRYRGTIIHLNSSFLCNSGSPKVPGDGDHGVFADPVGQAVMVLGVGQAGAGSQVDDQAPRTSSQV